jgi:adenylate cyclase
VSFLSELKRRNVFRAAAAYVAVAWLVMQVAEIGFPAFGLGDRALRLLILALAIGFVPAVTLAWVFELTPEGVKRDRDLDRSGPLVARTNRLLDRAIVVLLGLGVTYFAVDKFFLSPAREQVRVEQALEQGRSEALEKQLGDASIVVLPFTNLSTDPEQAFFADGMAEELLNLLARIPELRVISRTSAFSFKDKSLSVGEIADRLKVSHVLEGSVRRSDDRVRITAQLIDAKTDSHLWSETYDRTLDDLFEIQDDIAGRVVAALRLELLGEVPKSRRVDPQAYLLFMQARQMLDRWDDLGRIHALLQQALEIDPGYVDALTGLSWVQSRCGWAGNREEHEFCRQFPIEEYRERSADYLQQALARDPDDAVATAYLGWRAAFLEGDWTRGGRLIERALRLDPTKTDVLRAATVFTRVIRRPDIAVRLGEYVVARDPLCTQCVYFLARAYRDDGQLEDAERTMLNFALATNLGGWHTIGTTRLLQGDGEGALEALARISNPDDPWRLHGRSMALYSLGREEESRAELARLEAQQTPRSAGLAAEVYAWRGELDRALSEAERIAASDMPPWDLPLDWTSPFLRPVLETERGQAMLQRFGVADEQLAGIQFEVELPGETSGAVNRR